MRNRRPGGSALCWVLAFSTTYYQQLLWTFFLVWLSLQHLVSNSNSIRGPKGLIGLVWLSLPHVVFYSNSIGGPEGPLCRAVVFSTTSYLVPHSNCLTSVLNELYNSSTPTQSPTQSLGWHVWSSSNGNNCHTVHRSLSSGASLWSGTFTLSHIISRAHLRDFLS